MRLRDCLLPFWPLLALAIMILSWSPGWAAGIIVRDGDTIQIGDITYRLDGIDAPEADQMCIDDHADPWTCGVEARDQLTKLIGARGVHCEDVGADKTLPKRRAGLCTVDGETSSLNQLLVRQGFAQHSEPSAKGSFKDDEATARNDRRGLWRGCF